MSASTARQDRYCGCLLGLAAGDALGTTLEFTRPGSFTPITDMLGGGPFDLYPGQWTDDTSMALCLADSLLTTKKFDPVDQLERYWRWYQEGYLSSTGSCFDIGSTTAVALMQFHREAQPYPGPVSPHTAGNGSLMRLAPVPMRYASDPASAVRYSADSSRTTHGAPAAVDACRYFGRLLVAALDGVSKDVLLSEQFGPGASDWTAAPLCAEIAEIAAGSFKRKNPPEISGSGFVVRTLEAALWAFYRTESFEAGALKVVNLGEDSDTTGAVFGQIAGAYYGEQAIPAQWRAQLTRTDYIREQALRLFQLAEETAPAV